MRRVRLRRALPLAIAIELVGLLAASLVTFLTDRATGAGAWLATPIVAMVLGGAKVLTDALGEHGGEPAGQPPAGPGTAGPASAPPPHVPQPDRGGSSLLVALLAVLLVVGAGGFAAAAGTRYVVGYVTGNETGTDVLARPATQSAAGLTVTVNEVVVTKHFTRVEVVVHNRQSTSVTLPLFGNCTFRGADGTVLEADSFRSDWSNAVPPGGLQRGRVTFKGRLPASVTRASLAFSQVFRLGGGSVVVPVSLRGSALESRQRGRSPVR